MRAECAGCGSTEGLHQQVTVEANAWRYIDIKVTPGGKVTVTDDGLIQDLEQDPTAVIHHDVYACGECSHQGVKITDVVRLVREEGDPPAPVVPLPGQMTVYDFLGGDE